MQRPLQRWYVKPLYTKIILGETTFPLRLPTTLIALDFKVGKEI